jgi:hypothetical protein
MAESQKEKLMRVLGCSEEEALDIIETDKMIDQGKRTPYDLDPEQEKEAKAFARTRSVYNWNATDKEGKKRVTRKENPTKEGIIAELFKFLQENSEYAVKNAEIVNKQGKISFEIGGNSFSLSLTQHRNKK